MNRILRLWNAVACACAWPEYEMPERHYPHQSDEEAMRGDWVNVGKDMEKVIGILKEKINK